MDGIQKKARDHSRRPMQVRQSRLNSKCKPNADRSIVEWRAARRLHHGNAMDEG
jgi:hypothetical protein